MFLGARASALQHGLHPPSTSIGAPVSLTGGASRNRRIAFKFFSRSGFPHTKHHSAQRMIMCHEVKCVDLPDVIIIVNLSGWAGCTPSAGRISKTPPTSGRVSLRWRTTFTRPSGFSSSRTFRSRSPGTTAGSPSPGMLRTLCSRLVVIAAVLAVMVLDAVDIVVDGDAGVVESATASRHL